MKILFTGGGTGGHVIPIVSISRELRKIYPKEDLKMSFMGPKDDFGSILISQEGIEIKNVLSGKIRRFYNTKTVLKNFIDVCFKIPAGFIQSLFFLFFVNPDLIFSKGGYGSFPVVLAGKLLGIPVFLHESDISPGLSNRFLSKLATEIFVAFPKTEYFPVKKMIVVGNPIRKEILDGKKAEAKMALKTVGEKPLILILGGSQGAQRINDKVLQILPELLSDFEILIQVGDKNYSSFERESEIMLEKKSELKKYLHIFPFLKENELRSAFAASDLIVSRAGAGSVFEIAALGKPSILIPLPESAQNHQVKNAYAFQENKACIVMEEPNFTSRFFLEKLKYLFSNPEELEKMGEKAKFFAKPESGRILSHYLTEFLRQ